jgi:Na+/H+ antiporter NhaD/arsenite permease-like protein
MKKVLSVSLLLGILAWFWGNHLANGTDAALPVYFVIPFIAILLGIALVPLAKADWWHHNFAKVSLVLGLPVAFLVLGFNREWLYHTTIDYISFIVLLGALFTISGGILVKGALKATPKINLLFLITGTLLASLIGTTGASMLLIRPLLRTNADRKYKSHIIIFFIFLVSNIGGALTPLGDPPLFLGFLQGVNFFWTFKLTPVWLFACSTLLIIFFIIDSILVKKEDSSALQNKKYCNEKFKITGTVNFLYLTGVLGAVILYSQLPEEMNSGIKAGIQILIMLVMALLSLSTTPKAYRTENNFTWYPIKEVAILFACIFATMIPALKLLEIRGMELGVSRPWQFFWMSGGLSSFLDNAPTYLTFLSLGKAITASILKIMPDLPVITLIDGSRISETILKAISAGAVFMGANSYIGNGPNFMVKSVAEEAGVKMPGFLGYMIWSIGILIPLFLIITFVFFGA